MKKYLLMITALLAMGLCACNGNASDENKPAETPVPAEVVTNDLLQPTGDAEKDAQACVDFLVKTIEATDFTDSVSQKKLEECIKTTQETFDKYYEGKGEEAKKAFDEAGKKASEKAGIEDLITKKAMEALEKAKSEALKK
ncbi:MAG: hypothetical protein IJ160_07640 [Muribaculaceae bacterium]|nr:hypothetical protein [Muribaculaceae bacterium]